ncbi:MAG: DNA repair protein RecO [Bacteroidia bacterium]|jgi:DNA repair protein RecO (recombination protein O)|tara:strand:- start:492 stop:1202 length:711 start_codon:yes stop_codon:yes gene_type:complete
MIAKTKAIVLHNTNYSENSVISKMYTKEYGLRTYIIPSIRKGKSAIRPSMILALSLVELDIYEKANASINRIKELRNSQLLVNIHSDIVKTSIALFLSEILNHCITFDQGDEYLFDFLQREILILENEETNSLYPIFFLVNLSKHLGVQPLGVYSRDTPYLSLDEGIFVSQHGLHTTSTQVAEVVSHILERPTEKNISVNAELRKSTLNEILKYYQYHITKNRKIKSVEILSELLN